MDDETKPRRPIARLARFTFGPSRPGTPWWDRKRNAAAAILAAVPGYFAVAGPVAYAEARGWVSTPMHDAYFGPLWSLLGEPERDKRGLLPMPEDFRTYILSCRQAGGRHL